MNKMHFQISNFNTFLHVHPYTTSSWKNQVSERPLPPFNREHLFDELPHRASSALQSVLAASVLVGEAARAFGADDCEDLSCGPPWTVVRTSSSEDSPPNGWLTLGWLARHRVKTFVRTSTP